MIPPFQVQIKSDFESHLQVHSCSCVTETRGPPKSGHRLNLTAIWSRAQSRQPFEAIDKNVRLAFTVRHGHVSCKPHVDTVSQTLLQTILIPIDTATDEAYRSTQPLID